MPVRSRLTTRGERAEHRERARGVHRVVARRAYRRQRVVVVPAVPHRARAGQLREVGDGLVVLRQHPSERGDRHPHQLGVLGAELGVVDPERVEHAGVLGLDDDVGRRREATEGVATVVGVEVEHDAALRRVVVPPPQAAVGVVLVAGEGPVGARHVAAGRFDDDHVGPEVPEELGAVRAAVVGQLDDTDAVEQRTPGERDARGRGGSGQR